MTANSYATSPACTPLADGARREPRAGVRCSVDALGFA